jgi:hypothetical protein
MLINSAKSRLKTLRLLPAALVTPEDIATIKELEAQIAAEDASIAASRKRRDREFGTGGVAFQTKKVVGRRKKDAGSTFKLEDAAELNVQEHQALQRTITNGIEDDRRKAKPPVVDTFGERKADIELRKSMGDCFIPNKKLSKGNVDKLVQIDAGYHQRLIATAKSISKNEALHYKIGYGRFPFQRFINKDNPDKLGKVATTQGTLMNLLSLAINDGYTFTPCSFNNATSTTAPLVQRSTNAASNSHFSMVWMDYDDGKIDLDKANALATKYGFVFYETASSTPTYRKYRFGFLLSAPIHARIYPDAVTFFTTLVYKETRSIDDASTRETSRIFYGSKGANYYVPEQVKLYTVNEKELTKAVMFRESWVKKAEKFETRFNVGGDSTIHTAALNQNLQRLAEAGYAVRVAGTGTHPVYQTVIFALGKLTLDGKITEAEGVALWNDNFQDDDKGTLQQLWDYAIDETKGTGSKGLGSLIWDLKLILGSDFRSFADDESVQLPYNLSPSAKPDHTYKHISEADLPHPGSVQLEVSNTGCGKTFGTAEWLSNPETALWLKHTYMEGQQVINVVQSTLGDSAMAYRAMPNIQVVDGRQTYRFRKSLDEKWTEVTQAVVDGAEAMWLAANWNNTELVVRPNDPLNVQIAMLHSLGYDSASVTKIVMTHNNNSRESAYQKNQRDAQKAHKGEKVLLMAGAKFGPWMADNDREVTAQYTPFVNFDEMATFEAAMLQTTILTHAGLNRIPRMMQEPAVATVIAATNAWLHHLITENTAKSYPKANAFHAAKWFEQNQPAAVKLLRLQGSNVITALQANIDDHNSRSYKAWSDVHGKKAVGALYPDAAHQELKNLIMDTAIVHFISVLTQELTGEKHGFGMAFAVGGVTQRGPEIIMQRQYSSIKEMCSRLSIRIMAANCDRRWIELFCGCPVRTIAHEDFHGNSKMQNIRFQQVLLTALTTDTLPDYTLEAINRSMYMQRPQIVWCKSKHIDQIRALQYIKDNPDVRVCYFMSGEMTGSNTASHLTRMMFVGCPIANTQGTEAKLHALLGRTPTANELAAYIHSTTETAYQQAIGRLRGNRRQDEMLDVMLLTGEEVRFIAPCDGKDTIDIEDESIWVSRTDMLSVRTICPVTWDRIQTTFAEMLAEGDNNMPTIVKMSAALGIKRTNFAKACAWGGHRGIKSAWKAAKLLHMHTALAAALDTKVLEHTDTYTEKRSTLLADIAAYKADAARSKVEVMAAACGLALAAFVEPDGSYPDLFFGTNNLIHDVFNPAEHAELLEEWHTYTHEQLMAEDERKLLDIQRDLKALEALLTTG